MESQAEQRILLDALVSYSDACTLPLLTPSCPFYSVDSGRASCEEQCRDIATSRGAEPRNVRNGNVGGLVMHGRELPIRSVSGAQPFDAAEQHLRQRGRPLSEQGVSALLLGLEEQVLGAVTSSEQPNPYMSEVIWGELSRRGLNMERIVRGGLTAEIATAVRLSLQLFVLKRAGLTAPGNTSDIEEAISGTGLRWFTLLEASVVRWEDASERSALTAPTHTPARIRELWGPLLAADVTDIMIDSFLSGTPEYHHAMSREFALRVAAWFDHLFETDLTAAFSITAPEHAEMFTALPMHRDDIEGKWIWERFTVTDLDDWHASSLIEEWRCDPATIAALCPDRILNERTIDNRTAGERALVAVSDARPRMPRYKGIVPSLFISEAEQALREGAWERAAKIFAGVIELRPADAEAWNNLGFCQMGGMQYEAALKSFTRSAELPRGGGTVSIGNRTLLLHLLGRDEEALEVSKHLRFVPLDADAIQAVLWAHPTETGQLELVDQVGMIPYIRDLRAHIEKGACAHPTAGNG
ncbi:hypothetical protein SAMN06295974_1931 [Plantibacter flavus]|uniref:Uncharacterized protein n=1 Tax=Plantibacter flavus TaxID=150123 RepID=A0A3N2BXR0_9MICO|nr:tetratricopeptide repeat protein [Plantibacter flavus]ROR80036.1 hypothetical protein EDD42_0068 [Plantibacter flavus]SMG28846.1 hypothetical protein SAMN06295974_1931 [Plantibacter flavus]